MGNVMSNSESEDDVNNERKCAQYSDKEENGSDSLNKIRCRANLSLLFDHACLRNAASKIEETVASNSLHNYQTHLMKWLEDRCIRNEEMITMGQFCDFMSSHPINREDYMQVFEQFDLDGDGSADVQNMLDTVKLSGAWNNKDDFSYIIRTLQACLLTPGFIDVYIDGGYSIAQHGNRLLNFLLRNKANTRLLPFPLIEGFNNITSMRLAVLKLVLTNIRDKSEEAVPLESTFCQVDDKEQVTKSFSSILVSSNQATCHCLTYGDNDTYWQSDGMVNSHWIRLTMKPGIYMRQLSIYVAASDQSYMPKMVSVSAGKSISSLHDIKDIHIASNTTGDVVLLENAKVYYSVLQINIKSCQSDGCDTRIRGVKAIGFRVLKQDSVSVSDAASVWYLQVMASTVLACLPVSDSLKAAILNHTQRALQHMKPLSLSLASHDRPNFFSDHLLNAIDQFMSDLTSSGDLTQQGLEVLLGFYLARGHAMGLLKTIMLLLESNIGELKVGALLSSTTAVRDTIWKKHGGLLEVTLCGCDGGDIGDGCGPEVVLTNAITAASPVYQSEAGHTTVNMFFALPRYSQVTRYTQVTRLRIKTDKGAKCPRYGFLFVYRDSEPFNLEKHVKYFAKYDSWRSKEYSSLSREQSDLHAPVAYLTFEDEWNDLDINMDRFPSGQYACVKLIEPQKPESDNIGIVSIRFYGFHRDDLYHHSACHVHDMDEHSEMVPRSIAVLRIMENMADFASYQVNFKMNPPWLDVSGLSLELLWSCRLAFNTQTEYGSLCEILDLKLLHSLIPQLGDHIQDKQNHYMIWFKYLCDVVDECDDNGLKEIGLVEVASQIILDGASIFFPNKETRRQQLFTMMDTMDSYHDRRSVSLIFRSLCQFYSNVEPTGLLDLPYKPDKDFTGEHIFAILETLLAVASKQFSQVLSTKATQNLSLHLLHLLCSLQTSFFVWCQQLLLEKPVNKEVDEVELASTILTKYVQMVGDKATYSCKMLHLKLADNNVTADECTSLIGRLEHEYVSTTVRQLVLMISEVIGKMKNSYHLAIITALSPLVYTLQKIAPYLPDQFFQIDSKQWESASIEDVVLRTWNVESSHSYENNQHTTQMFSCPGANVILVEFDSRCETERRYDYLLFTDSRGNKMQFDQKVGTAKWPKTVTFKGAHRLSFLFHSDGSNVEWGYKFKVIAKGFPDVALPWMLELQLSTGKILGQLASQVLKLEVEPRTQLLVDQDRKELERYNVHMKSELWSTLLRGGLNNSSESLSGQYPSNSIKSELNSFLTNLVDGTGELQRLLITRCEKNVKSHNIGKCELDETVTSVFSCLVWHSPQLRENINNFIQCQGVCSIDEGVYAAYHASQSMKLYIVDQQQKQRLADEKQCSTIAEDIASTIKEKALFLLNFAGSEKISIDSAKPVKSSKNYSKKLVSYHRWNSYDHQVTTIPDKYPTLRLIIGFLKDTDPMWTVDNLKKMLQLRSSHATDTAAVYQFSDEFIRSQGRSLEIWGIMYLQEMLCYQTFHRKHYLDRLQGCGLELEHKVQQSYYSLIRTLQEHYMGSERVMSKGEKVSLEMVQAFLLHLLDIQWKRYDLHFVQEADIPSLLISIARGSVAIRSEVTSEPDDTEELSQHNLYMSWLTELKKNKHDGFSNWYDDMQTHSSFKDKKKSVQMFIAKFCDLLEVEIWCDGCGKSLPGRRYRCLQCVDLDLCATCYAGGVKPGPHQDDHYLIYLTYKCDECNSFITGQRIHCTQCDDFDLCYGCFKKGIFPPGHSPDHHIQKFNLVRFQNTQKADLSLQAYIYQHVWLLFASTALQMAGTVFNICENDDKVAIANKIHKKCVDLLMACLSDLPSNQDTDEMSNKNCQRQKEEEFAIHSQERILGLLGAMVTHECKNPVIDSFCNEDFFYRLFSIAKGESGHESNTQHLAMGLISQLLQRVGQSPQVVDKAISSLTAKETTCGNFLMDDSIDGSKTVNFLFSFGATCLKRSGMEWASTMVTVLQDLLTCDTWTSVVLQYLSQAIQGMHMYSNLNSVFSLFIMAGFPEVMSIGKKIVYSHENLEPREGLVLSHFPDKYQTFLIDSLTRRTRTVRDEYIDCMTSEVSVLEKHHFTTLVQVVEDCIQLIQDGRQVTVEKTWILSLCLKAICKSRDFSKIFQRIFIQKIVYLACLGTGFCKQWLTKDLEVLSLMLYTHDKTRPGMTQPSDVTITPRPRNTETMLLGDSPPAGLSDKGLLYYQLMVADDEETCDILAAMHDDLPQGDRNIIMGIKSYHKKQRFGSDAVLSTSAAVDVGIQKVKVSDTRQSEGSEEEASSEEDANGQTLIKTPDNDVLNTLLRQQRTKSASLLRRELEEQGKTGSRKYLNKVNLAVSILWARQVLLSVLADWPETCHVTSCDYLANNDGASIPCILDLLNKAECQKVFVKAVKNVLCHCNVTSLRAIAATCCYFMEGESLQTVTVESEHPYMNNTIKADSVFIEGASHLSVKFDNRCITEQECDWLLLSSSKDLTKDKHAFSGPTNIWKNCDIPGDTLYYKFSSDCSTTEWGYRFTVIGCKVGRFETGYLILNELLTSQDSIRHLEKEGLWQSLVRVACRQQGQHRLRTIQLILRILYYEDRSVEVTKNVSKKIDLCLLKPLWHLYQKVSRTCVDSGGMTPPVVRALTEVFMIAEKLAQAYHMEIEYIAKLWTVQQLHERVFQSVVRVAAISVMVGVDSAACDDIIKLQKEHPPGYKK